MINGNGFHVPPSKTTYGQARPPKRANNEHIPKPLFFTTVGNCSVENKYTTA